MYALRLDAEGLEGTAGGSFGFNKTLDYAGTGVLKGLAPETSPAGGTVQSLGGMLGGMLRGAAVATGFRAPFFVGGTFAEPQFSLSRPPLIRDPQEPMQQPRQPKQRLPREPNGLR